MDKIDEALVKTVNKIIAENDGSHFDLVIPGYAAKRLIAYQGMIGDLDLCLKSAALLLENSYDSIVTESLYITIIISYGKCFTDASISKYPKLEIKDCFNDDNDLQVTHKELMDMRHNFIAHRGVSENDVGIAYLQLYHDLSLAVRVKRQKAYSPSSMDLKNFIKLFEHLRAIILSKYEKEAYKVWKHIRTNYKPEYFTQLMLVKPKTEANHG